MPRTRGVTPFRKAPGRYHHGDLQRALVQEAIRTIQSHGIAALTLRDVGTKLGVSRTAPYRHFADKQALLAAVAAEGFHMLRTALQTAWGDGSAAADGLDRMGHAYVRFAVEHSSHYRVMFSEIVRDRVMQTVTSPDTHAFQVLADAILAEQGAGRVREGDPHQIALYVWSVVHGVAMLAIDGMLPAAIELQRFVRFAIQRIHTGIAR
jgi:AcrR family transcriptional regulator